MKKGLDSIENTGYNVNVVPCGRMLSSVICWRKREAGEGGGAVA